MSFSNDLNTFKEFIKQHILEACLTLYKNYFWVFHTHYIHFKIKQRLHLGAILKPNLDNVGWSVG